LASFSRQALVALLSSKFKAMMALVPGLQAMVTNFLNCRFKQVFAFLSKLEPDLRLDLYVAGHVVKH